MQQPTKQLAKLVVAALEDLKGIDIKVIDVARHTSITDWWVVCTGTSNRHVRSLAENVVLKAKEAGERTRIQGLEKSEWVLVDLGGVVVHVLQVQARAHYQLEKLIPEPMPELRPARVPAPKKPKPGKKKAGGKAGKGAGKKKAGAGKRAAPAGKGGKPGGGGKSAARPARSGGARPGAKAGKSGKSAKAGKPRRK